MGNCCSLEKADSQTVITKETQELTTIAYENLLLLEALSIQILKNRQPALCFIFVRILKHLKTHYVKQNREHSRLERRSSYLDVNQLNLSLKELNRERALFLRTQTTLKKLYKKTFQAWTTPALSELEEAIVTAKVQGSIEHTLAKYYRRNTSHGVQTEARNINNGKELTTEERDMVKELCDCTTYLYNDTKNRVEYTSFVRATLNSTMQEHDGSATLSPVKHARSTSASSKRVIRRARTQICGSHWT